MFKIKMISDQATKYYLAKKIWIGEKTINWEQFDDEFGDRKMIFEKKENRWIRTIFSLEEELIHLEIDGEKIL